jgi:Cu2+-exporting ATPase
VLVEVQRLGRETRFAQIVALMEKASTEKPRLAVLADRIAAPFLVLVLAAAALAANSIYRPEATWVPVAIF